MRSEPDSQVRKGAKILVLPAADLSTVDDTGVVRAILDGDRARPASLGSLRASGLPHPAPFIGPAE